MRKLLVVLALVVACGATGVAAASAATVLVGSTGIRPQVDSNNAGVAEAFRTTAGASGTVDQLTLYVNATSTATRVVVGLYADASGHPGALLAQGATSSPVAGAYNDVTVPAASVTAGSTYWIAVLGSAGRVTFRDQAGAGKSETSAVAGLTNLPSSWQAGTAYTDGNLSAYGSSTGSTPPPAALQVTPTSLSFSAATGGADPGAQTASIANGGGGTLSFTTATDAAWLAAAPASGSAPGTVTVTPHVSGLTAGTYTGHVTVTASGATGSPATIAVTLTVTDPAPPPPPSGSDWLQIDHDAQRTGFASGETTLGVNEARTLGQAWATQVDGKVTGQPLYVSGITAGGQVRNLLVVVTDQQSVYALDADSGSVIWRRAFGTPPNNCAIPGGFGIVGPPAIDKARGRVYVVTEDGVLRTIDLISGADLASGVPIITGPQTNRVWGGLNLTGGTTLYVATASDGCDSPPWRGRVLKVDVSGATPSLAKEWDVVPGIAAPSGGGGIWGYGGVAVDGPGGNVYAATGADSNETYTQYSDRLVALSGDLGLLGSFEPFHPTTFPCTGAPCDVDFGSTPVVFQPTGCPTMVAAGNKNGILYVSHASTLAASGTAEQALQLNPANDWLGSGGIGGVPAWWPAGQMLFVSDTGPGWNGVAGGVVGLKVNADCTLSVAWSQPLGGGSQPDSTPTVANGVVYVGEGVSGRVDAFAAATGELLWQSAGGGAQYGAPMVANGTVYAGGWNGFTAGDAGTVRAFRPGATPPPSGVLLGDQNVESQHDQNALGSAEAFQTTAAGTGTVSKLSLYLDAASTATKVTVGLYADNGSGHPGTLLTSASTTTVANGAWNEVAVPPVGVTSGKTYWIALLGSGSGTIKFRDTVGGCSSEASATTSLTALPATWTSGTRYHDCPLSAFGSV